MMSSKELSRGVAVHVHMIYAGGGEERIRVGDGAGVTITDHYSGYAPLAMRTKRRLASALQQWHNFFQEGEQSQMVGSIANRAITDLIREGNAEGLRNFLASRKSHVDDKDEVMPSENVNLNLVESQFLHPTILEDFRSLIQLHQMQYTQYEDSGTVTVGRYQNPGAKPGTLDIKF